MVPVRLILRQNFVGLSGAYLKRTRSVMASSVKSPPESVRGMTDFDPARFDKTISVPVVEVPKENTGAARKLLGRYLLKMANLQPVQPSASDECKRKVLMDPDVVQGWQDITEKDAEILARLASASSLTEVISFEPLKLTFEVRTHGFFMAYNITLMFEREVVF